jgi:hypothetical protein
MAFWTACHMKAIKEQVDEELLVIKLFSGNYARDLLYIKMSFLFYSISIINLKKSFNTLFK